METDITRFEKIFTEEEMARIVIIDIRTCEVDLHGKTTEQAKRFLNNIINVVRHPFTLEVIHGYNHGIAILKMIREDLNNPKIVNIDSIEFNPGETILKVA